MTCWKLFCSFFGRDDGAFPLLLHWCFARAIGNGRPGRPAPQSCPAPPTWPELSERWAASPPGTGTAESSVLFNMTKIWEEYAQTWVQRRLPAGHRLAVQHPIVLTYDDSRMTEAGPVCRHNHRDKQAPGWRLEQAGSRGWFRWTTPSGRSYLSGPTQYPS